MNAKNKIKKLLINSSNSLFIFLRYFFRLFSREGRGNILIDNAISSVRKASNNTIISGPFSGMIYVDRSVGSALIPKLIGSYEEELQALFVHLHKNKHYTTIIDIGCAEGYYAVGLATFFHNAFVFAFDIDDDAKALCFQMAKMNHVSSRLLLGNECTHISLIRIIDTNTLLIVDCEGAEYDLLDPLKVPELLFADMIVELHDFADPRITPAIIARFSKSHNISFYTARQRDISNYPAFLAAFGYKKASFLIKERDLIGQKWAFLEKKS